ncbi:hypothetical protein NW765_010429 [Fusarium oxysporum]|nr:hypothetical protein NW765_010429 [Fusarium oxysporum]KAJ4273104.1 hypothetical protein NW764_012352 [Fusarium oxysporum]
MGHFWDHAAKMHTQPLNIKYGGKGEVVVRDLKGADKMDSGIYRAGEGPLRASSPLSIAAELHLVYPGEIDLVTRYGIS